MVLLKTVTTYLISFSVKLTYVIKASLKKIINRFVVHITLRNHIRKQSYLILAVKLS